MEFLGTGEAGERPRFGITMFRGRSGAGAGGGLLDSPVLQTPPTPPQRASPPPRPPRPPRRLPRLNKKALGGFLWLAVTFGCVALLLHVAVGGDAYWDHNMRGNAAYGQGDWGGAVSEYSQMVAINPKRQDGYSLRAMAYFKLKQFRLSAADFRMALRYNDDAQGRAVGYQNLAYSEDYYGDHAQAIRDFTEAIRLDPTIPDQAGETADAHDDTGSSVKGRMWAYYESGQYPQALADCQALIAVHPYPSSIAVRGKIYRHMGQYGPAFADFRAALRQDPRLEFASDQLADLLAETRQYAAAVQVAQAAAQADPSSSDWRGGVGWWQYRAGQTAAAIASYRQALSMGGPQPITRFNLALAYATLGDWTDTQPALAQALWVGSPTNCHWARVDVRSALVQQPRSVPLRKALAMLQAYRRA